MVSSMTAYGRSSLITAWGSLSLEIQSVNRKFLEINTTLPKEFMAFDSEIKKHIQKKIFRGKLHLVLNFSLNESEEVFEINPNMVLALEIQKGWHEISKKLSLHEPERGLIHLLCKEQNLMQTGLKKSFVESAQQEVIQLLDHALDELSQMRLKEGAFLKKEIVHHLDEMENLLKLVQKSAQNSAQERQYQLKKRIEDLLSKELESDERLLKEVAIIADKSDITEEIARIFSHLNLFKQMLDEAHKSIGKALDFIVQELNREWNTIGSKCNEFEISHRVIQAKSECEKIREQVQNIE